MSFNAMSTEQPDGTVGNDGWFPSLSVRLFLTLYRLPGEYAANNDAKEGRESADAFFAFAHDAIADLLGCSRVDVALI